MPRRGRRNDPLIQANEAIFPGIFTDREELPPELRTQPDGAAATPLAGTIAPRRSSERERIREALRPAGVLIPVIDRREGLSVLLTQRSATLKHHAGQVSFPGGRMEAQDSDVVETALREAREEVGIRPESVAVIGYLPPMPTVTGYAVTAVVGLVTEEVTLQLDPTEVEYAFEVPLAFLLDGASP